MSTGVPVPAGVVRSGQYSYTLSWELYRALQGKTYSGGDKIADNAWEQTQKVQTLWWDHKGFGHVAWMPRAQRDAFEYNRKVQREKRFRDWAWETYKDLQGIYAFRRETCNLLLDMRKALETLDA